MYLLMRWIYNFKKLVHVLNDGHYLLLEWIWVPSWLSQFFIYIFMMRNLFIETSRWQCKNQFFEFLLDCVPKITYWYSIGIIFNDLSVNGFIRFCFSFVESIKMEITSDGKWFLSILYSHFLLWKQYEYF